MMRAFMRAATLVAVTFAATAVPAGIGLAAPPNPGSEPPYREAVDRAIRGAQERLEGSLQLWVDRSQWDSAWEVRSEHFLVRTTKSRQTGEAFARGLEGMLVWFRYVLGDPPRDSGVLPVYLLPDMNSYNQFGDDFGGHHSSKYGSFFAEQHPERAAISFYYTNELLVRQWVTHSVVHQYLNRCFPLAPPPWIDEGLAAYFEIHWDYENKLAGFRNVMTSDRFLPLDVLLEDTIDLFTDDHFTELGMLVYYLLHEREDTCIVLNPETQEVVRAPFRDYLRDVLAGRDVTQNPVHLLVTERVSELEKDFRNHTFASSARW